MWDMIGCDIIEKKYIICVSLMDGFNNCFFCVLYFLIRLMIILIKKIIIFID